MSTPQRNKTEKPGAATETEIKPPSQKGKKIENRSLLSKIFRGFVYFSFFIILLIAGAGAVLEYYFPAEEVRVLAEKEGAKQLQLPLSIKRLEFSLFRGVQVDGLVLGPIAKPLASVETLALDYDFLQLLQGNLVINRILVDQPQLNAISKNGIWNFQPLLNIKDSENTSTPSPQAANNTSLPFAKADLQQFNIRNVSANLSIDDQLSAHIKGLNLEARGKASMDDIDLSLRILFKPDPYANIVFERKKEKLHFKSQTITDLNLTAKDFEKLNISGTFSFKQNKIQFDELLPSPNVEGSLSAEIQMRPERINLSGFSLSIDEKNEILLSTTVNNFSSAPEIEARIKKISFQLADIIRWGKKRLPPLSGKGRLEARNLNLLAKLPGFKPDNITLKGGLLSINNLELNSSGLKIHIEGLNSSLQANEVSIKNGLPEKVSANIKLQLARGQTQEAEIQNWKQSLNLQAKGKELSQIKLGFKTDIESLLYRHPSLGKFSLPLHSDGSLEGDWKKGNVNLKNISYHSGKQIKGSVSGKLKQKNSFQLKKDLSINIGEAFQLLPKEISEKVPIGKATGQAKASLSLTGTLDSEFIPAALHGKTLIDLKTFSAKLEEPDLQFQSMKSTLELPLDYQAGKGVKIANLNLKAHLGRIDVLKNWRLSNLSMQTNLKSDSFYNLKTDFGTLPVKLDSRIKLGSINSTQPELSLSNFSTRLHLKGDLRPDDFRNSQLKGNMSFKNAKVLKKLRAGEIASQFLLQARDKSLSRVRLSQKTDITSFNLNELDLSVRKISLESRTRKNLQAGNFDLDRLNFKADHLVDAHLKGSTRGWGEKIGLESAAGKAKLASIWEIVPANIKKSLDVSDLEGTIILSSKIEGSLPPAGKSEKDLKPFQRWEKRLKALNPNNPPPLKVSAHFQLKDGKIKQSGKSLRGMNLDTRLDFKNGSADLSGNVTGELQGMEFFEKLPLKPELNFQYHLENLNTFSLARHQLDLKNRGIRHTLEGKVDGLRFLLKAPFDPARILQNLNIALKNENNLKIQEAIQGNILGDLKATGELASKFEIHQAAGETLNLEGQIGFDRFTAEIPSTASLKNLTGRFPFRKSLSLNPGLSSEEMVAPLQKSFFRQLRNFSRHKNNIRADSLEAAGQKAANLGMDLLFQDNRLTADKFIFDILGGTVGGNFSFTQSQEGPTLKFFTEFAKIDASRLLTKNNNEQNIDSKIDGNMEMALKIKTGETSLDELLLKIAITKIGPKTLDRLLLFIDPKESKPAIVDTRTKLKIASPHRVLISLENGNLNMEAWLKSDLLGIIKMPELKRIPIAGLKQFTAISEQLQALQGTLKALNIIAAKRVLFENGKLIFKN